MSTILNATDVTVRYNDRPILVPNRYGLVDINTDQTIDGVKTFNDQNGIGGEPDANAILDLQSTTQAFLPPRMTTTQRDAISSPVEGMLVYNTTTSALNYYDGSSWGAV